MQFKHSVSVAALALAAFGSTTAQAQNVVVGPSVTVTPANANVLNLLSPFLGLNGTPVGQQTLQLNLSQAIADNQNSTTAQKQLAISDKALPGGPPFATTITLANGTRVNLGPGDNIAGGLPLQAAQSAGGLQPLQPVGGLGPQLGPIYQTGIRSSTATTGPLQNTFSLLNNAYNVIGLDLGVAKNYFANGAQTNSSGLVNGNYLTNPAVAPPGYTLPTAPYTIPAGSPAGTAGTTGRLPNRSDSVLDLAYGVRNTDPGQDVYGSSRPVQARPSSYNVFDPTALSGLATNPSFPSGHTQYAFTDGYLLAMLVPQQYQNLLLRASEYGDSRIVLGVHYPLDIIASRAFAAYDVAQLLTNPQYINNAATTGTAVNLPAQFVAAQAELQSYLSTQCGNTVAACANSATNTNGNPYVPSAANQALYQQRLTYGLPTLTFAQAPREAAPAGGPDASILLAPLYGGSTTAARTIEPNGGIYGNLSTSTINQIIVNTENTAFAAFYGTALSYWTRINLYDAAGYFDNVTGTLTLQTQDRLTRGVTVGNGGTLYDNGTITGAATVNSGGRFGGTGTVGGLTVNAGGTVAPGNSIGTLNVAGRATFAAGSTYAVEVAGGGRSDRIAVTGQAAINGGTVSVSLENAPAPLSPTETRSLLGQRYTILTATQGVAGRFDVVTPNYAFIGTNLDYTPNAVNLSVARNATSFASVGATRNQAAVGGGVEGLGAGNALYERVLVSPDVQTAQGAFQALSGDVHASANAALFETAFFVREAILDRLRRGGTPGNGTDYGSLPATYTADLPGRAAPISAVPARVLDPRVFGVWGQGFGAFGSARTDGNANGLTRQVSGFVLGADLTLENGYRFGVAGGYSYTNVDTTGRLQTAEVGSGYGAVYGGTEYGPLALRLGAVYADNSLRTRRTVIYPGASETETARYGGSTVQGFGELGYRIALGSSQPALITKDAVPQPAASLTYIEPFVGGAYVSIRQDRFQEIGGIGALRGLAGDNDVGTFTAGMRAQTVFDLGLGAPVSAYGMLGYRRAFGDVVPTALLAFNGGPNFIVAGIPISRDALVANAGLDLNVARNTTIGVAYTAQVGERAQDHAVKGNVTFRW